MKLSKTLAALTLAGALALTATPAQAASVHYNTPAFTKATKAKLATPANKALIAKRAKAHGSPKAFEKDIRGCEIQYKVRTVKQSDCLNMVIRIHRQYI